MPKVVVVTVLFIAFMLARQSGVPFLESITDGIVGVGLAAWLLLRGAQLWLARAGSPR